MKKSFIYLGISAFVFIFSQVYEHFSHGVYSGFMIYAFLIPFVGSIYKGVLEKYGTSTNFEIIYLTVGLVLCILAGILMTIKTNIKAEG